MYVRAATCGGGRGGRMGAGPSCWWYVAEKHLITTGSRLFLGLLRITGGVGVSELARHGVKQSVLGYGGHCLGDVNTVKPPSPPLQPGSTQ